MIRRAVLLLLALVVPIAVLLLAGRHLLTREDWLRRRLHEAVAIELAQTLDSEVKVGQVEGDLIHGFRLRDVAISDGRSFADGVLASAKTVEIKCNTWIALRGGIPPMEAVEAVRVVGLRGRLMRGPDGRLNVQRLFPKAKAPGRPGARFRGRVVLEGAEVLYTDRAPTPPALTGLELRLVDLDAIADFGRPGVVEVAGRAQGAQAPFSQVEVSGAYAIGSRALSLNGGVRGADLPAIFARVFRHPAVRLLAGTADLAGNVCLEGGRLIDYAVQGRATAVAATVAPFGGARVAGETEFAATPAGLALRGTRATVLGATVCTQGVIFGFSDPCLDFAGSAEGVDLERWAAVVPDFAASLPETSGAKGVRLEGRVSGPVADPDITVSAAFPEPVAVRYAAKSTPIAGDPAPPPAVVQAEAAGLTATVSVPDIRTRDVVVRLKSAETRVADLGPLIPAQEYVREIVPAPVRNLEAEIVYSRNTAALAGRVEIGEIRTDRGTVSDVQVRYAVLGRTLRAEATARRVLGGRVAANGVLDLADPTAVAYAQFDADQIDLAAVAAALEETDLDLEGTAGATGVVAIREGRIEAAAEVQSRDAHLGEIELEAVRAHLGLAKEALDVRYLAASGPLGALWARGNVPFDGPAELEVAAAGVPLEEAQAVADRMAAEEPGEETAAAARRPLTGVGFAHGWLRGELHQPELTADVALFGAGIGETALDALAGRLEASPEQAILTGLLARRGTAVLSGGAALREIAWPAGSFFSDQRAPDDQTSPPAGSPVAARLEGDAQVRGLDLLQIDEFAPVPDWMRLAGAVEGQFRLRGTLQAPQAQGRVSVRDLLWTHDVRSIAVGPLAFEGGFTVDRDSVRLEEGSAESSAGSLAVSGEIGGWNSEEGAVLAAKFEATNLPLSAYTPPAGPAALLEGTVQRVAGAIAGPLSDPWPSVRAEFTADELRFGRRRAQDVRAKVGYDRGVFAAHDVVCGVARGNLRVAAASYQPADDKLFADLTFGDLDAQQLLFLAADIAAAGRTDEATTARRDRLYAYGHRVRGRLGARRIVLGGTPGGLEGRVSALTADRVELDRRAVPGLTTDFRFAGLALSGRGDAPSPPSPRPGVPAALARLRIEGLRARSEPIGHGIILVHGADVTRDGSVDMAGTMDVVVEANLVPVAAVNDWLPAALGVGGDLSLTVRAMGPVEDPEIVGSLNVLDPTVAGVQFDLLEAANVALSGNEIVMTGGLLKRGRNEVQAEGSLPFDRERLRLDPEGPVAFEARVEDLPAAVPLELAGEFTARRLPADGGPPVWGRCRAEGLLTAWLKVEGKLARPEVTGGVSVEPGATFRMSDWAPESALVDIAGDVLLGPSPTGVGSTVEAFNLGGRWQDTRFAMEGSAEVSHLEPEEWLKNRIDELTLTVKADQQRLPGGTPAKGVRAVVKARTDPEGRHIVTVEEGAARLGRGSATLTGNLIVDTLDLRELGMAPCDLRLVLERAQVQYDTLIERAQVDGAVVARKFASRDGGALPDWFLQGRAADDSLDPSAPLVIATARAASPGQRAPLEVTRAKLGVPSRKRAQGEAPGPEPGASDARGPRHGLSRRLPAPRLDMTVAVGHYVDFETVISRAEVAPDPEAVRLTGTPQAPELHAAASMRHGSLRLLRGNLDVPEAGLKIDVTPLPYVGVAPPLRRELRVDSEVWGRAEGTVSGTTPTGETIGPIKVALDLSGGLPPDHVLTTRSDPPLTSNEVYELLAVGPLAPGGELTPDPSQTVDQMVARAVASRVFRGVLEPIEEELSETLGLEQFDIRVGLNQPVEFRVGKYLVDNLLVSYMRTAGGPEEEYDLRVSYKLKDKYQITWHADQRQQSAFAVEYRWQF